MINGDKTVISFRPKKYSVDRSLIVNKSVVPIRQNGSSLIEVMVALFILAVGLLGILAMQANSIKLNNNAYLYSQADMLSKEILESIYSCGDRASSTESCVKGFRIGLDDSAPGGPDCTVSSCLGADLASWYLRRWREDISSQLPGGKGAVTINGQTVMIEIEFNLGFDREVNTVGRQGGNTEVTNEVLKESILLQTSLVWL